MIARFFDPIIDAILDEIDIHAAMLSREKRLQSLTAIVRSTEK